jgi:hypothetical protein
LANAKNNRGTKGKPSVQVSEAQRGMGGLSADGIYGPGTRQRAATLGVSLPAR